MTETSENQLVLASPLQCAARWRLHHQVWGNGYPLEMYLKREESLFEADFCRTAQRMWLLCKDSEILASCETYRMTMAAMGTRGIVQALRGETIASVVVDPRLRRQGYAGQLLQLLLERLRFDGTHVATLYSDVGPSLYRQAGFLLHPARESTRAVQGQSWPNHAEELGIGDVANVLANESEQVQAWLGFAPTLAVAEVACAERVAWFHQRSQFRAWARGTPAPQVVGAQGPDGGYCLWTADSVNPKVHILVWRPISARDAAILTEAALAHGSELGLAEVIWWDADRDTGIDPYRQPQLQPQGAVGRARAESLPMLAWLDSSPFPLLWAGIERAGWA